MYQKRDLEKRGTGDAIADLGEMGLNPVDVAWFRDANVRPFLEIKSWRVEDYR